MASVPQKRGWRLWRALRDGARTQLWPIPTVGVLAALALGVTLPRVDRSIDPRLPDQASYLFTGGADSARSVLEAISGSLITVTSLTFSLTVVTLQLASSQFSPRLLRTFTRDLVVQGTLALFLGTFTYSLTVLRTVRTGDAGRTEFVPGIAVTVAFLLALASVIGLVLFLAHLTRTIRVESMLRSVHQDASATAEAELEISEDQPFSLAGLPPADVARPILADSSGFLVSVDAEAILASAVEADAVVMLLASPGSSIVSGVPIGAVWSRAATRLDDSSFDDIGDGVRRAVRTGFERTSTQDVSFGLRQLTDVALKALSPGINDPTTAVHALGHSSALLGELSHRDLGPGIRRDEDHAVRVILRRPGLEELLDLAIAQPARYGAEEPAVLHRILALLEELAWTCRPHQKPAIRAQVTRLTRLVENSALAAEDRTSLTASAARAESALDGTWVFGSRST